MKEEGTFPACRQQAGGEQGQAEDCELQDEVERAARIR